MYIVIKSDELQHYGIKGMRWGVRKDENGSNKKRSTKDKSSKLTSIKKKAGKSFRSTRNLYRNVTGSRKSAALKKYRRKNIDGMSDDDLKNAVYRMNMEKQYRSLTKMDFYRGQRIVNTMDTNEMVLNRAKSSGKAARRVATAYGAKKAAQIAAL